MFRSRTSRTGTLWAAARGALAVVRAPALFAAVYLAMLLVTIPFAIALGAQLQAAIAARQLTYGVTGDIDAEWWLEFDRHAQGLAATFSPVVVGSAAAVSNASGVLDGTLPVRLLVLPIAASTVMWAFIWGGILERLHRERPLGSRAFVRACVNRFVPFAIVSAVAAAVYLLLYATVHRVLFDTVAPLLQAAAPGERGAFLSRVVLYSVFGACLLIASMFADYLRVMMVVRQAPLLESARITREFLAAHARTVVATHAFFGGLFVLVVLGFVVVDVFGGRRVEGWPVVAVGQMYIAARMWLLLSRAGATLDIVKARVTSAAPVS